MTPQIAEICELYRSEQLRLRQAVRRIIGNPATADELVHDAFAELIRKHAEGRVADPRAYLGRTARNLALNHIRRRGEAPLDDALLETLADPRPDAEHALICRQELMRLLSAVAALPARRREVFVLSRFYGMTYDQIAARMQISRNTVMVQIVNALADLNRALVSDAPTR